MSIEATRAGFEASFEESNFYNKQTQDENHLNTTNLFFRYVAYNNQKPDSYTHAPESA